MSDESSNSQDWAVVTNEGELEDESEDDRSCSGSSIELLTSEDDNEVDTLSHDYSVSDPGRQQSGPFFILRLRSKEYLAESDSDDKEEQGRSVPTQKRSSVSSEERSEPELLAPLSADDTDYEGTETNKKDSAVLFNTPFVSTLNEDAEKIISEPKPSNSLEVDILSIKPIEKENIERACVTQLQPENELSSSPIVVDTIDNMSFPSRSCSSVCSEVSCPDITHLEVPLELQTGNPTVYMDHVHFTCAENLPVAGVNDDFSVRDDLSMTTSSLGDSNFSVLDQDECMMADMDSVKDGSVKNDNDEDGFSLLDDNDTEDMTTKQNQESKNVASLGHHENISAEESESSNTKIVDSPPVRLRRPKPRKLWKFAIWMLELMCFVIIGIAFYLLGHYQDSAVTYRCLNNLKERNGEVAIFQTHFNKVKNWKNNLEAKKADAIDWLKELSFDQNINNMNKHSRHLDEELNGYEQYIANLVITAFDKIKTEKSRLETEKENEIARLKLQLNELRNDHADLQEEVLQHGKRKYLVRELEDENLALIKRINDLENQLMEAEDQSYILQLQMSKKEKSRTSQLSNEDDNLAVLKQRLGKVEEEKNSLVEQFNLNKNTMDRLKVENERLSIELSDAEIWKEENKELKIKWGVLSVKVQHLQEELRNAQDYGSELEQKISDLQSKTDFEKESEEEMLTTKQEQMEEEEFVSLKEENNELKTKVADIEESYKNLLETEKEELEGEVASLKEENKRLQEKNTELFSKIDDLKEDLDKSAPYSEEHEWKQDFPKSGQQSSRPVDDFYDEGVEVPTYDDIIDTGATRKEKPEKKQKKQNRPGKWTIGKISKEKLEAEKEKENTEHSEGKHKSWSDAINAILNKTKISMDNVSRQIQDTLSQVKNMSEELWKKHEPKVNHILSKTYEKVKENVNTITEKVTRAASKIIEKSSKWIKKFRKSRKSKRYGKKQQRDDDADTESYSASTSRRNYKENEEDYTHDHKHHNYDYSQGDSHNQDHRDGHNHYFYHHQSFKADSYPGFLENELQNLQDSVEYVNTLQELKCNELVDIMEDFQGFKKSEGLSILTKEEKVWFFCQKSWFENMVYSDPYIDSECTDKLVPRQLAANDHKCCPCFGQYGNSKGKFCQLSDGCNQLNPKEKKSKKMQDKNEKITGGPQEHSKTQNERISEVERNETAEEEMAKNRGKFIYCDPFSLDLDCGDESWYLKRMKDREHLRKYRTSLKTDWLFHRAEDRDYHRTRPDDWFFNRVGGQAYEAHQDDSWQETENWYIHKINDEKKSRHHNDEQ